MFKTRITDMLGIRYPIVGGAMMRVSTPEFVAAVCNAGALGILPSVMYRSREAFAEAVDRTLSLTAQPFAVNINLFPMMQPIDNNEYVDVLIDKGVKIVETSGHSAPDALCRRLKDAGMTWIHKCVGVRYARKVEDMGADIVTVVGYENGGAIGKAGIGTLVLVPRVVEELKVPVIGGGGVSDGRGFLALLALGAQGVIMGTRLLATRESLLPANLKQALVRASELDTVIIMQSIGSAHRVWANAAARTCAELDASNAGMEKIIAAASGEKTSMMYQKGDLDLGVMSCGQGVGLAHDIPTVRELLERIIGEAEGIIRRFAGS